MTDPIDPMPERHAAGGQVPPPGGTAAPGAAGTTLEPTKDEKTMGALAHLLPLIIWLIKKDESKFVDDQGKESLNFWITVLIPLVFLSVLSMIPFVGCILSILSFVIVIVALVFAVVGAVTANKGVAYRYPINLRLIK